MRILLLTVILNWNLLSICGTNEDDKDWWQTTVVSYDYDEKNIKSNSF